MSHRLIITIVLSLGLSACDARFSYEYYGTPPVPPPDLSGLDLAGVDLAPPPDGLLSMGTFEGRAGHGGEGGASLVRRDGKLTLEFAADFSVSGVPGPFVFLTSRADMGNRIDAQADVEVSMLKARSGEQSYPLPEQDFSSRPYVFVFCKPFTVEVARAQLRPAQ